MCAVKISYCSGAVRYRIRLRSSDVVHEETSSPTEDRQTVSARTSCRQIGKGEVL